MLLERPFPACTPSWERNWVAACSGALAASPSWMIASSLGLTATTAWGRFCFFHPSGNFS